MIITDGFLAGVLTTIIVEFGFLGVWSLVQIVKGVVAGLKKNGGGQNE